MPDHVYKTVEITGSSATTVEDAVPTAIARASKTLHDLRWFEVTGVRGGIAEGRVGHWQVTLIVNSGMGTPFGDLRIARVGGAALACANRRRASAVAGVPDVGAPDTASARPHAHGHHGW